MRIATAAFGILLATLELSAAAEEAPPKKRWLARPFQKREWADPRVVPARHEASNDPREASDFFTPGRPATLETPLDAAHPMDLAKSLLERCRGRFANVKDYTCTYVKQERIDGVLRPVETIEAKFQNEPFAAYFRWVEPDAGKEMLYVSGANDGKILTHATGFTRVLTGTMRLDPESPSAKKETRQTIKEAGIANLIEMLLARCEFERRHSETKTEVQHVKVNGRRCLQISAVHPTADTGKFQYHTLRIFIDKEKGLPVRVETYGYPKEPGRQPGPLLESHTYLDIQTNVGLTPIDFSPRNPVYRFARF